MNTKKRIGKDYLLPRNDCIWSHYLPLRASRFFSSFPNANADGVRKQGGDVLDHPLSKFPIDKFDEVKTNGTSRNTKLRQTRFDFVTLVRFQYSEWHEQYSQMSLNQSSNIRVSRDSGPKSPGPELLHNTSSIRTRFPEKRM